MVDKIRLTRHEIAAYKREILESSVLVRLDEAAEILAIDSRTLSRRIEEGRIAQYNDNRTRKGVRILASELQRYVREMRQEMQDNDN
jgi:excisionase family DNA binding protein